MKKLLTLLTILTLPLLNSGCGMFKNMDEMHDSTAKMSNTTEQMSKTTQDMADTTNGMAKDVNFTYMDMRIGNTRQARQEALAGMKDADDVGVKMGYASEYYAAMEYQFWKPSIESAKDREDMMTVAVKDFFKKIREYIANESDASATREDAASQNLYAMAATLHYVNNAQLTGLAQMQDHAQPVVTMLSMIEDGLKVKADVESGKVNEADLPAYQVEVLRQEQVAVYVLRTRQNFLKAFGFMLAASYPEGQEPSKGSLKLKYLRSRFLGRTWAPNFADRNSSQINYNAIVLEYAVETLGFLKTLGYEPMNDKIIGTFLSSMTPDEAIDQPSPAKAKAIDRFKKALAKLTQ